MQAGMVVRAIRASPRRVIVAVIVCTRVVIVAMIMVIMMVTVHVQRDGMEHGGQ